MRGEHQSLRGIAHRRNMLPRDHANVVTLSKHAPLAHLVALSAHSPHTNCLPCWRHVPPFSGLACWHLIQRRFAPAQLYSVWGAGLDIRANVPADLQRQA
jgi:hypothetical protein